LTREGAYDPLPKKAQSEVTKMEKRNIPSEIQLHSESGYEPEEIVLASDENPDSTETDPPQGFEDLLYEADKENQTLNCECVNRTKRKKGSR